MIAARALIGLVLGAALGVGAGAVWEAVRVEPNVAGLTMARIADLSGAVPVADLLDDAPGAERFDHVCLVKPYDDPVFFSFPRMVRRPEAFDIAQLAPWLTQDERRYLVFLSDDGRAEDLPFAYRAEDLPVADQVVEIYNDADRTVPEPVRTREALCARVSEAEFFVDQSRSPPHLALLAPGP